MSSSYYNNTLDYNSINYNNSIVQSNSIIIHYLDKPDDDFILKLPTILDLYRNSSVAKAIHQHMMNIYKAHNIVGLENDLSFWQILLHNFFISVLYFGRRNGILCHTIKRANINIAVYNSAKFFELLNMARDDIKGIIGDADKFLSEDDVLEKVYKIMDLQIKKYGKKTTDDLACNKQSVAKHLRNMVLGIKNKPPDPPANNNRFYDVICRYLEWSKLLTFSFLVFVLVAVLALCVLYFLPGVAFIFTFFEANVWLSTVVLLSGCASLSIVSTGLFMLTSSDKSVEICQPFESVHNIPSRIIGQVMEGANNEQVNVKVDLPITSLHVATTPARTANDDQRLLRAVEQDIDKNSNTAGADNGMSALTNGHTADLEQQHNAKKTGPSHNVHPNPNGATATMLTNTTSDHNGQKLGGFASSLVN